MSKQKKVDRSKLAYEKWIDFPRSIVKFFIKKQTVLFEADENSSFQTFSEKECVKTFEQVPCIFVCNHERAFGPLVMLSHFPLKKILTPWIIGEVCSRRELPKYAKDDFWVKPNKWYSKPLTAIVGFWGSLIVPPVMRGMKPIKVYHDGRVKRTILESVDLLSNNGKILLFPEKPTEFKSYSDEIMSGFVLTARLYFKKTKKNVPLYPVYIDKKKSKIIVGLPLYIDNSLDSKAQAEDMANRLVEKTNLLKSKSKF